MSIPDIIKRKNDLNERLESIIQNARRRIENYNAYETTDPDLLSKSIHLERTRIWNALAMQTELNQSVEQGKLIRLLQNIHVDQLTPEEHGKVKELLGDTLEGNETVRG